MAFGSGRSRRRRFVPEQGALQEGRDKHDEAAADDVIPEISDVGGEEEDEHERLRDHGGEEYGGAAHVAQEERDEEKAENAAVKDRAENVAGLDQVFDQAGERRDRDRDQAPGEGQPPRRNDVVMVARFWLYERAIKIDRAG